MRATYLLNQCSFVIRKRYYLKGISSLRKAWLSFNGMKIGNGTLVPKLHITWPHQVVIGKNCLLENEIVLKYDGIWTNGPCIRIGDNIFIGRSCEFNIRKLIEIGDFTHIASGCKFVDHDHGIEVGKVIGSQESVDIGISIGRDVWLGYNVIVLKGIHIGDGAVIGAGSVVTKNIKPNEIWARVPAQKIGDRR